MRHRFFLYFLILLSGGAGLVYEVVWARQLTLFIGTTAYANAAVLTAFMAGLALGSLVLGRVADKVKSPIFVYALLEIGIGIYGLTTPWLFGWIQDIYIAIAGEVGVTGPASQFVRFAVAIITMIIPTFLMGGTLPLLVRHFVARVEQSQAVTARIYGLNTFGAALGAFSAGFILLPAMGITFTLLLTALINLAVGALVYLLLKQKAIEIQSDSPAPEKLNRKASRIAKHIAKNNSATTKRYFGVILLTGFALSGFAALVIQVIWIQALILVIGTSVYAFSSTLTSFLVGIALGSIIVARWLKGRDRDSMLKLAAILLLLIGLSAVFSLTLLSQLPVLYVKGWAQWHSSYLSIQALMFGLSFLVMLVPTLLLGALFPLVTAIWSTVVGKVGSSVGQAYGANAAGTIGGALLGGLFFVDWFGIANAMVVAALLCAIVSGAYWWLRVDHASTQRALMGFPVAVIAIALAVTLLPGWEKDILQAQVFRHSDRYVGNNVRKKIKQKMQEYEFLYYGEGTNGIVSVLQTQDRKVLLTNGKADASNTGDLKTQILHGAIPMLIHPNPRETMQIGYGSGITVGTMLQHTELESMDMLEISPEVIEASDHFAEDNHDALNDPRVNLIVADARNYLLASEKNMMSLFQNPPILGCRVSLTYIPSSS